jgi:predicted nucleic acid-binding protein
LGLTSRLGVGPVALDSAVFIYYIEGHAQYRTTLDPLFSAIDAGRIRAFTSAVTLLEVLVAPYREKNFELATEYELILTRSRGLQLVALRPALLRLAASLRAQFGLRTPDALQAAAGAAENCTALVTNDRRWPAAIGPMRIVQLAG